MAIVRALNRSKQTYSYVGVGLGSCLLFISLYQAEVEKDLVDSATGEAIGSVISAISDVSRRPSDRLLWFPLETQKQVYARDTVRTGPDSSLRIELGKQGVVELKPDSLAVLETNNDTLQINLASGDLFIKGSVVAKVGDSLIQAKEGSFKISRDTQSGKLEVQSQKGRLSVTTKNKVTTVESGEKLTKEILSEAKLESFPWTAEKPFEGDIVTLPAQSDITFNGHSSAAQTGKPGKLQIARDKNFKKLIFTQDVAASEKFEIKTPLPEGRYFWRVTTAQGTQNLSVIQQFERRFPPSLSWTDPFPTPHFKTQLKDSGLDLELSWASSTKGANFHLDVKSKDKILFSQMLNTQSKLLWRNKKNTLWQQLRSDPKLVHQDLTVEVSALANDGQKIVENPIVAILDVMDDRRPKDIQNFTLGFSPKTAAEATLSWKLDSEVDHYELRLGTQVHTFKGENFKVNAADVYKLEKSLMPELRAFTSAGVAGPWTPLKFDKEKLALSTLHSTPVKLYYPVENRVYSSRAIQKLQFTWSEALGNSHYKPTQYELIIQNTTSTKNRVTKFQTTQSSLEIDLPLPGVYQWQVRALWPHLGQGALSESKSFTVKSGQLDAPQIRQPAAE